MRPAEAVCSLDGPEFRADLSTHGASLRHFVLKDPRFDDPETKKPMDLVTTSAPSRMP